jgi:hypothetical protein
VGVEGQQRVDFGDAAGVGELLVVKFQGLGRQCVVRHFPQLNGGVVGTGDHLVTSTYGRLLPASKSTWSPSPCARPTSPKDSEGAENCGLRRHSWPIQVQEFLRVLDLT